MTSIGCGVDIYVGGTVPDYKYVRNKLKSEFLTGQVEYSPSCERLGSCLATECLMRKSSMCTLFLNVDASPPTSTLCSSDIIHMISVPRLSLLFTALPLLCACEQGLVCTTYMYMYVGNTFITQFLVKQLQV